MLFDPSWLSREAQQVHGVFLSLFYGYIATTLLLGVVIEYFRWPLGGTPSFGVLVGRALVAALLLSAYPEISNAIADFSDGLAGRIGDLNTFSHVLQRLGERLDQMSVSWTSVRETVMMAVCFLSFLLVYFSVFIAEGIQLFAWTLCFVFSPALIAMFVLPSTAQATSTLFRSLIEIAFWKVVWSVLAALLWSSALSQLSRGETQSNFVSVVCMNLALAGSVLMTPWVVRALTNQGLSSFTRTVGGLAVGGTLLGPSTIFRKTRAGASRVQHFVRSRRKNDIYNKK